ncbi:MAG: hypothetical protein HYX75_08560 [Acidobacteria bacterium]|nr:hypothetical protein [Acidobacteriota bacterium]
MSLFGSREGDRRLESRRDEDREARLWDFERQSIAEAYARNHANITRTAHYLGLERNCLKYKLKKFGIAGQGTSGS